MPKELASFLAAENRALPSKTQLAAPANVSSDVSHTKPNDTYQREWSQRSISGLSISVESAECTTKKR